MGNFECCAKSEENVDGIASTSARSIQRKKVLASFQNTTADTTGDVDQIQDSVEEKVEYSIDAVASDLDDMKDYIWDGPEDSDEEVESLVRFKTDWEKKAGIRLSKRGIIEYIEKMVKQETSSYNSQWEEKAKETNMTYFLKTNGS